MNWRWSSCSRWQAAVETAKVGYLKESDHANMKELRFDPDNGVWRVAYAFDPERKAILLVAGDIRRVTKKILQGPYPASRREV